jgi:hypothetical protein
MITIGFKIVKKVFSGLQFGLHKYYWILVILTVHLWQLFGGAQNYPRGALIGNKQYSSTTTATTIDMTGN